MRTTTLLVASLLAGNAFALGTGTAPGPGDRIDDFMLLDHQGQAHKLYYLSDASAVVLMAHSATCPGFADYQSRFEAAADAYRDRDVAFLMVNSEPAAHAELRHAAQSDTPILIDQAGLVGDALRLTRLASFSSSIHNAGNSDTEVWLAAMWVACWTPSCPAAKSRRPRRPRRPAR